MTPDKLEKLHRLAAQNDSPGERQACIIQLGEAYHRLWEEKQASAAAAAAAPPPPRPPPPPPFSPFAAVPRPAAWAPPTVASPPRFARPCLLEDGTWGAATEFAVKEGERLTLQPKRGAPWEIVVVRIVWTGRRGSGKRRGPWTCEFVRRDV